MWQLFGERIGTIIDELNEVLAYFQATSSFLIKKRRIKGVFFTFFYSIEKNTKTTDA
jgi:hypothetical protein